MARLAPSLRLLFTELDDAWPRRDRRTDGWLRFWRPGQIISDHNPDRNGWVHAIDIDRDGIDPDEVVRACIRHPRVTNYVIWNRRIWSQWRNFRPRTYTGTSNPHTDHIHVSIFHTETARQFGGPWGIAPQFKVPKVKAPIDAAIRQLDYTLGLDKAGKTLAKAALDLSKAGGVIRTMKR